jgi:hypothetical protein
VLLEDCPTEPLKIQKFKRFHDIRWSENKYAVLKAALANYTCAVMVLWELAKTEAARPPPTPVHLGSKTSEVVGMKFIRKFGTTGHEGVVKREVTAEVEGSASDRVFDVEYEDNDDEQLSLSTILLLSDREWLNTEASSTAPCGKKKNKPAAILLNMLQYE